MTKSQGRLRSNNLILDSLPVAEYDSLRSKLQAVELRSEETLHGFQEAIDHVYFPTAGLLSSIHSTSEGDTVEIGVTGNEGTTGVPLFLGHTTAFYHVEVQLPGTALKLRAEDFLDALEQSGTLRRRVAAFTYLKMTQLAQSGLCNRFHTVEERLCRWLLVAQDRVESSDLLLTRDVLAQMIGSRRPAVSLVTGTLQSAGLLRAQRGKITILNREEMEAASCECYQLVKRELNVYLNQKLTD